MTDPALASPTTFALYAVRFATEVASLVAFLVGGLHVAGPIGALVAPAVAGAMWGRWMAPKSGRRLADPARLAAELAFFTAAAGSAAVAGHPTAAATLAFVAFADALVLRLVERPVTTSAPQTST